MEGAGLSQSALVDFIYREARLLDEKRFDEWYELLTEIGRASCRERVSPRV